MRYLLGLALALLLTASVAETPGRMSTIAFAPVQLDLDHPERREFDSLRLLGAWRLASENHAFGGISSLHVTNGDVLALGDSGEAFRFYFDGVQSRSRLRARELPALNGRVKGMPDVDSESMAVDPRTGRIFVGFETSNAVRAYSPGFGRKLAAARPRLMRHWPENGGSEAMARLADGRFVVFGEQAKGPDGTTEAILFPGNPVTHRREGIRFYYTPPTDFFATDAAQLPDGRLLVLNRHFSIFDGLAAAVTLFDPRDIARDRIIKPRLIARLAPPLAIDNMEGLSVEQGKAGEVVVWIISDDNFIPLQRTLLLKFALDPALIR